MEKLCFVLLGDTIRSRHIVKRSAFEKKLSAAVFSIMEKFGDQLLMPIKNWKGLDEVAAIISDQKNIFNIIWHINEIIFPVRMRFVMARGNVNLKAGVTDISLLDGDAFHKAANLMLELKKEELMFKSRGENETNDLALDNQVNMLFLLSEKWTEKQMKMYACNREMDNQKEIAKKFKISQQSVSKTLNGIQAAKMMELEKRLSIWAHTTFTKQTNK